MDNCFDIVVIGGGPAGLAAAISAREAGVERVLIIERDQSLGGILNQCSHCGFGREQFNQALSGPEYAARYVERAKALGIESALNTTVLEISDEKAVTVVSPDGGLRQIAAGAVILAMGCRERPRGALNIPGYRPAGVYTAGAAQRLINIEGYLPGTRVVILGSGDIGLITARRMAMEGAKVEMVVEAQPYPGGQPQNLTHCLEEFGIPLLLSHTVVNIHGHDRVEGVTLAQVDESIRPVPGTEKYVPCDTLLLSVGLLPENELTRSVGIALNPATGGPYVFQDYSTSIEGIFACGNVLHVHDLVENVSREAAEAGAAAAAYIHFKRQFPRFNSVQIWAGDGIRYTIPNAVDTMMVPESLRVRFRVSRRRKDAVIRCLADGREVLRIEKDSITPGRMEELVLPGSAFLNVGEVAITVDP